MLKNHMVDKYEIMKLKTVRHAQIALLATIAI